MPYTKPTSAPPPEQEPENAEPGPSGVPPPAPIDVLYCGGELLRKPPSRHADCYLDSLRQTAIILLSLPDFGGEGQTLCPLMSTLLRLVAQKKRDLNILARFFLLCFSSNRNSLLLACGVLRIRGSYDKMQGVA